MEQKQSFGSDSQHLALSRLLDFDEPDEEYIWSENSLKGHPEQRAGKLLRQRLT